MFENRFNQAEIVLFKESPYWSGLALGIIVWSYDEITYEVQHYSAEGEIGSFIFEDDELIKITDEECNLLLPDLPEDIQVGLIKDAKPIAGWDG